jgi:hypothetical protein
VRPPTDLDLLAIQAEWSVDDAGRLRDRYGMALACTGERQALWVGARVPDRVAAELTAIVTAMGRVKDPAEQPRALEPCRQLLEADGHALRCTGGPSYVFSHAPKVAAPGPIVRSVDASARALRHANPGNWHPVEWDELLDGRLGPWTMILDGGRAVSICHTPHAVTERGAECGVWTDPAFRGRGYAAAVTAAWAALMRPSGRHLFYSTDAHNVSSQRVAERLRLRLIGWTWRVAPESDPEQDNLHPLCSLRRA